MNSFVRGEFEEEGKIKKDWWLYDESFIDCVRFGWRGKYWIFNYEELI